MKYITNSFSVFPFIGYWLANTSLNENLQTVSLIVGILAGVVAIAANISKL